MKPAKIFSISLNMVRSNKLRSWLTIIGVIIGIASVMAIVTTGEYFQDQVTETLESLGGDTIKIVASVPFNVADEGSGSDNAYYGVGDPEEPSSPKLTRFDVLAIQRIPEIEYINVNVDSFADVEFGTEIASVQVSGVDPRVWPEITDKEVSEGRLLNSGDRRVVVISNELANEAFEHKIRLNQMLLINGRSFRVVGILEKDEGLLGGLSGLFGSSVFMPYEEVYSLSGDDDYFAKERGVYDSIEIKLYEDADNDAAIVEIERKLRLSRRVTEDEQDFYVSSSKDFIESTGKIIDGLTAFLALIAGISLLVGSVGIANTMFTSVLEKTKEIGIMKAIGASNEDIMLIFLCNAALIGLVGGVIGILMGTMVVQLIMLAISMMMETDFVFALSVKGTLVATIVSIVVGLIAGYVPAKNASKLNPVDALRYE